MTSHIQPDFPSAIRAMRTGAIRRQLEHLESLKASGQTDAELHLTISECRHVLSLRSGPTPPAAAVHMARKHSDRIMGKGFKFVVFLWRGRPMGDGDVLHQKLATSLRSIRDRLVDAGVMTGTEPFRSSSNNLHLHMEFAEDGNAVLVGYDRGLPAAKSMRGFQRRALMAISRVTPNS